MTPDRPSKLVEPVPASEVDRAYHLRKGTTRRAVDAGRLPGCFRQGRGGMTCWILPEDALSWFRASMPTEPEGTKP